jgi:hypothetical protein
MTRICGKKSNPHISDRGRQRYCHELLRSLLETLMEAGTKISGAGFEAFGRFKAGVPPIRYQTPVRLCDDPHFNFVMLRGRWTVGEKRQRTSASHAAVQDASRGIERQNF